MHQLRILPKLDHTNQLKPCDQVPWDDIVSDVCVGSITAVFALPGSQLEGLLYALDAAGSLSPALTGISEPNGLRDFCDEHGRDWVTTFFGPEDGQGQPNGDVGCAWNMEDRCRATICPTYRDPLTCYNKCLTVAKQMAGGRVGVLTTLYDRCLTGNAEPTSAPTQAGRRTTTPYISGDISRLVNSFTKAQQTSTDLSRLFALTLAKLGTEASEQTEYVVGLLLGLISCRHLLHLCVSLFVAFIESTMNLKAMFPGSAIAGYYLIFVTLQRVPLFVAALAFLVQTLGDELLTTACCCFAASLLVGMRTGLRVLHLKGGERDTLYAIYTTGTATRVLLLSACLALISVWSFQEDQAGIRHYVMDYIFTPLTVVSMVVGYFRAKALSTITGTDGLIAAFGDGLLWSQEGDPEGHDTQIGVVSNLREELIECQPESDDQDIADRSQRPKRKRILAVGIDPTIALEDNVITTVTDNTIGIEPSMVVVPGLQMKHAE